MSSQLKLQLILTATVIQGSAFPPHSIDNEQYLGINTITPTMTKFF